jgi:hypothetical protein
MKPRLLALLGAAATAAAGGPDLVMENIWYTDIRPRVGFMTIEFTYDLINIGDAPIDLGGPDHGTPIDNVGVQTWLADEHNLNGTILPAAGASIVNPVVLGPDEVYSGVFQSNTNQLPDPTQLGDFRWLVIDITNTPEDPADLANNRKIVWVPIPCGPADRAPPFGVLDLADITHFVGAFTAQEPDADCDDNGIFDLSDVVLFVQAVLAGCR